MKLTAAIEALPQPRPRFNGQTGRAYEPAKIRQYKQDLAWLILPQLNRLTLPLEGAVKVTLRIYKSASKFRNKGVVNLRYGDADNLQKPILDVLKELGVYRDDKQIAELHFYKFLGENPSVELAIEEMI